LAASPRPIRTSRPCPISPVINPPDRGIRGNSHMIMQDKNSLQIADMVLQWIDEHVRKRSAGKK
jgi:hypothetical protein